MALSKPLKAIHDALMRSHNHLQVVCLHKYHTADSKLPLMYTGPLDLLRTVLMMKATLRLGQSAGVNTAGGCTQ